MPAWTQARSDPTKVLVETSASVANPLLQRSSLRKVALRQGWPERSRQAATQPAKVLMPALVLVVVVVVVAVVVIVAVVVVVVIVVVVVVVVLVVVVVVVAPPP